MSGFTDTTTRPGRIAPTGSACISYADYKLKNESPNSTVTAHVFVKLNHARCKSANLTEYFTSRLPGAPTIIDVRLFLPASSILSYVVSVATKCRSIPYREVR
jgi:hypothetical protein